MTAMSVRGIDEKYKSTLTGLTISTIIREQLPTRTVTIKCFVLRKNYQSANMKLQIK